MKTNFFSEHSFLRGAAETHVEIDQCEFCGKDFVRLIGRREVRSTGDCCPECVRLGKTHWQNLPDMYSPVRLARQRAYKARQKLNLVAIINADIAGGHSGQSPVALEGR